MFGTMRRIHSEDDNNINAVHTEASGSAAIVTTPVSRTTMTSSNHMTCHAHRQLGYINVQQKVRSMFLGALQ